MTSKRKIAPAAPYVPGNFHADAAALGLRVVAWRGKAVVCDDGASRWLPRDLIGEDGKTLIVFREVDSSYAIDGWEPWHDGMFGGRYDRIGNALAWVKRAKEIRAGAASDFRGV